MTPEGEVSDKFQPPLASQFTLKTSRMTPDGAGRPEGTALRDLGGNPKLATA